VKQCEPAGIGLVVIPMRHLSRKETLGAESDGSVVVRNPTAIEERKGIERGRDEDEKQADARLPGRILPKRGEPPAEIFRPRTERRRFDVCDISGQ
jgi:hypothetical protein